MAGLAKHLSQNSASQGFKMHCAWALGTGNRVLDFNEYLGREDVQAAYPVDAPEVSELDALRARIAELEGTTPPVKETPKVAQNSVIGRVYVAANGGREHTIVRVEENGEFAIADTGNIFRTKRIMSLYKNRVARKAAKKAYVR